MELDDLGKQMGEKFWAVRNVNLSIRQGEFFGLLGPSGCGKSTTLNLIAGFLNPTEGSILLSGKDLAGVPPHRRGTAMVFQDYALFPHLTAAENIAFGPKVRGDDSRRIQRRVAELLTLVGLSDKSAKFPSQLSGGQQQRVAVARALAVDPDVVLLDEPLSNLDARLRAQMRFELRRLFQAAQVTVIFVTHDQAEAFEMCDRVAVMSHGTVLQVATPEMLYQHPASTLVAEFVGEGNFLPATVIEIGSLAEVTDSRAVSTCLVKVRIELAEQSVECQCQVNAAKEMHVGQVGNVLIRPESLKFTSVETKGGQLTGVLCNRSYNGDTVKYAIDVGGAILWSKLLFAGELSPLGAPVSVQWRAEDTLFLPPG